MNAFSLHHGDCLDVLTTMDAASVGAIVTDPPYGLEFMGREWDAPWKKGDGFRRSRNPADAGRDDAFGRASRRGPEYVAGVGFQQWCEAWAAEALRVLKPGAHLAAFGGTRTYHRLASGIEDAGFEVRDCLAWLYGQGFPKSPNVLKPAHEPIVLARKPMEGTVVANVSMHGTGEINVDGCRIATDERIANHHGTNGAAGRTYGQRRDYKPGSANAANTHDKGRWPANVVLDDEAAGILDAQSGTLTSGAGKRRPREWQSVNAYGFSESPNGASDYERDGDSGGASRFFYTAKASKADRGEGNTHPTVKPVDLMRWLVRLVTPPGGTVLDPFAGSGTTGVACLIEGFPVILIEREDEYVKTIRQRLSRPIEPVLFGGAA